MDVHSHTLTHWEQRSESRAEHCAIPTPAFKYSAINGSSNEEQRLEYIRQPPILQLLLPMRFDHPQHIAGRILRVQMFEQMILLVLLGSQCPHDLRASPHAANSIACRVDIVEKRAPEQLPLRFRGEERRAGRREPDTCLEIKTTLPSA